MPGTENGENRPRKADVSIEMLHQQLQDGIDAIESGEDWRAWLNFAGRLHRYSFNNLILIWRQRPDATSIASYRTWHSVHRQVRRGERALRVMAPVVRRTTALDSEGKVVLGPDGQPGRRQQVVGFRPAAVFDISQTDGPQRTVVRRARRWPRGTTAATGSSTAVVTPKAGQRLAGPADQRHVESAR